MLRWHSSMKMMSNYSGGIVGLNATGIGAFGERIGGIELRLIALGFLERLVAFQHREQPRAHR